MQQVSTRRDGQTYQCKQALMNTIHSKKVGAMHMHIRRREGEGALGVGGSGVRGKKTGSVQIYL